MKYAKKFSTSTQYNTWRAGNTYQTPSVAYITDETKVIYNIVINTNGYTDYVDLGLPSGTLWSTMNLGAQSSSDVGDYLAWGEFYTKENYSLDYYELYNSRMGGYDPYGYFDNKTVLDLSDDVVNSTLGGSWHIPTRDQWQEILDNTTMTPATGGLTVEGPNGNTMFLPATGFMMDNELTESSTLVYMCNEVDSSFENSYLFILDESNQYLGINNIFRYYGYAIRPVAGKVKASSGNNNGGGGAEPEGPIK